MLWLAAGIGYGLVSIRGRAFLAALWFAAFLDALLGGHGAWSSLAFSVVTTAAVALTAELVRRLGRVDGERVLDTLVRLGSGAAGAVVGAVGLELERGRLDGWTHGAAAWFAGYVVAGPLLRTWLRSESRGAVAQVETAAVVAASAGLAELAVSGAVGGVESFVYLLFPPLLWAALRTGRRGVASAALVVAVVTAESLADGRSSFSGGRVDPAYFVDVFLMVLVVTALLLAGVEAERRESEATLRRSEERFRALIDNATDIVTVATPDGKVVYESPSATAILGWTPEELREQDVFRLIHPDDLERVREGLARVVAGSDVVIELRFRHREGRWVEVVAHGRNLLDDPAVGGIVFNSHDVSASRLAERERAEVEARYRMLVERLPLVTYVNGPTPDAPRVFVSRQLEELLGHPLRLWYDDPRFAYEIVHPDDVPVLDRLFAEEGEDSLQAEYRLIAADGRVVWVLDHMVAIRDVSGERVSVQGFLVDVTERRQLEEQLQMAQRLEALGLLAGGVAHDFNNLLTAIGGNADLAEAFADDRPRLLEHLGEVRRATRRAAEMTRQLLAFARRQVLEQELVDLNSVVRESRPLLERLLGDGVELTVRLEPRLDPVRADPTQLGQVLLNLAVNARDAMPGGGRVTIATANEGDSVLVSVADTGPGVAPEAVDRLFEPFFTTKPVGEGTGLGLAVVHGIVRQSEGRVDVRSEPGRGAEFRVLLPRAGSSPRAGGGRAGGELPRGGETVLVVEDEELVRRLTVEMLERQGYDVIVAASPEEALAVEGPYALVLTDVVMPGMSGPALAALLQERRPGLRVLFTSGYSDGALGVRPELCERLLEKPFTLEQLARRVREALDAG